MSNLSKRWSTRGYIALVSMALLAAAAWKLRVDGVFACPATGYAGDAAYLADCRAANFGDYDHGAAWFGLEPDVVRAAASADVLLLGNSKLQFAFSGAEARDWFRARGLRHYLFGFSFTENTVFVAPLLARLEPKARVYVINVDRFFDDRLTPITENITTDPTAATRYREKRGWQRVHRVACGALPVLCGDAPAVFRRRDDGGWTIHGDGGFKPQATSAGEPTDVDRWPSYSRLAGNFIAQLPVRRSCAILTHVPASNARIVEARAIAQSVGVPLVEVEVDGLRTFDGTHLDPASAQRWSAAFLKAAEPVIRDCVGDSSSAAR